MRIWVIGIVVTLALGLVGGAMWLPLGSQAHETFSPADAGHFVMLTPGHTLTQHFRGKPGWLGGLGIYTQTPRLHNQRLRVVVTDAAGKEISRGVSREVSYAADDATVELEISLPWVKITNAQPLTATLSLIEGESLAIRVASDSQNNHGTLRYDGRTIPEAEDLPLKLIMRQPLSFESRQGVLAAAVFMVSLALIHGVGAQRRQWWLTGALLVAVTPLALGGFWFSADRLGIADWDYYFSLHEYYRQSIVQHHAFPLWNPYTCGGTAGLADPEFPVFSLTFLLELIFGVPTGLRLAIYTTVAVTAVGMLALARRLRLSLPAATVAALGAAFGSVSLLEMVEGHVNVFASMWLPWILWSWLRALAASPSVPSFRWRDLLPKPSTWLCSLFLALTFFQGGIYLLMYTALALLLISLMSGQPGRALLVTWQAGVGALGLSAIKLVPVLLWLRQFPDQTYASSAYLLPWLDEVLIGRHRHGEYIIFRQGSGWHEYGAYLGLPLLTLALIGTAACRRSRTVAILLLGALATIMLATSGPALQLLFDTLPYIPRSNISRVMIYTALSLSLLAGFGLDRLRRRLPAAAQLTIALAIIGFVAVDLFSLGYVLSAQSFVLPQVYPSLPAGRVPPEFTQRRFAWQGQGTATTRTYPAARAGYGTFAYCSVLGPSPAVKTLEDEDVHYPYVQALPAAAQLALQSWSPNRTVVQSTSQAPTKLILNTNYAPGWTANGQPAETHDARVAATIPAGQRTTTFEYEAPGSVLGSLLTLLTVIGSLWQLDRRTKDSRA